MVRALRDAGMEVIYTGLRASPRGIALAALQEDVDAVGISNLSGAHGTLFPEIAAELTRQGIDLKAVVLFGGGTIPADAREPLLKAGYRGIFGPGTAMEDIVAFLRKEVRSR